MVKPTWQKARLIPKQAWDFEPIPIPPDPFKETLDHSLELIIKAYGVPKFPIPNLNPISENENYYIQTRKYRDYP